ncbi:putative phosphodiesterase [Actinoplanes campanulatus]|uniref:Putative phosphodiesterase n=1 Tax=Actinoplanes campanulatus TaxID=113559 RepID=A0A7W5ABI3_9ACTN|nr:metallophosphoesterase [Actinoplanes campanulatus]MBB3093223.1 putative phosphodiesterase [Actinoplanes campanulatus]GGN02095.1 membrane protein [Actinoplanes campanulatus]GID33682.1 membrane protein [Actinoplanes campanulatus]
MSEAPTNQEPPGQSGRRRAAALAESVARLFRSAAGFAGFLRAPAGPLRAGAGFFRAATGLTGRAVRHRWSRRLRVAAAVGLTAVVGSLIGVMLFARSDLNVGPFSAEMSVIPSVHGGTEVNIPPLGSLHLDSHRGPVHLRVDLGSLDQSRTEALIDNPAAISTAGERAVDEVVAGVARLGLRTMGLAVLSTLVLAALIFRDTRRTAAAGLTALVVTGGSLGLAAATLRPNSISEPRYEGLLVNAPAVVGDARRIADNYGRYSEQLQAILGNVSRVYSTISALPVYEPAGNTTRLLHVSDLHLNPTSWGLIRTVVDTFDIDAVIDTGDIVDWGSSAETSFVASIPSVQVPYIYVRGNHDSAAIQAAVARQSNAVVLDDALTEIDGLTIAGIGDPQFTPDKSETNVAGDESGPELLTAAGDRLAQTIRDSGKKVDIALVHDPAMAQPLSGVVPLVLAGHLHRRVVSTLPAPTAPPPGPSTSASPVPSASTAPPPTFTTRLMVEGSTGGAGLRGLEGEDATPLSLSVLYFDENNELKAYDDIQLGGTGESNVEMQRNVIGLEPEPTPTPAPSLSSIQPSR